ncbi:hypothetical protein WA158_000081 [Blastocystis sp. Blastoise]
MNYELDELELNIFLEEYIEKFGIQTKSIQKDFALIRKLDEKVNTVQSELEDLQRELMQDADRQIASKLVGENVHDTLLHDPRYQLYKTKYDELISLSEEKYQVSLRLSQVVENAYSTIQKKIQEASPKYDQIRNARKDYKMNMNARRRIRRADGLEGNGGTGDDITEYCICHQPSYGDMIQCDNPKCLYKWFHFSCVGLTESPEGTWYCPQCREEMLYTS